MKLSERIRDYARGRWRIVKWADEAEALESENETLKLRTGICEWEYDEAYDKWDTSCSNSWQFIVDGPKENDCQYCIYCGGVIDALLTGGLDEIPD